MDSDNFLKRWIQDNYASRRGLVRTCWHRFLYICGCYRKYRRINWGGIDRLVFVCKGNICRSAFAEAVARSLGMEAVSCGLRTIVEAPANEGAVNAARVLGYDLREHRTKPIMYLLFRKTDLIIVMEPWQAEFIDLHLSREHSYTLLGLWHKPVIPHIQDPFGSSCAYFERCFNKIEMSVHEIVTQIKNSES